MTAVPRYTHSFDEYLMLEEDAPAVRHQFIDGEILAMAGGSELHSALIASVNGELYAQLRGKPCGVRESNLRVRVEATGNAFYTDGIVVCGPADIVHEIRGGDSLLNPSVIIEVVSPSSEKYDRGEKFDDNYRYIPSLRAYVLVAQDGTHIEVRSRDEEGSWTTREYRQGQTAVIAVIDCALDVDAIYGEAKKNAQP